MSPPLTFSDEYIRIEEHRTRASRILNEALAQAVAAEAQYVIQSWPLPPLFRAVGREFGGWIDSFVNDEVDIILPDYDAGLVRTNEATSDPGWPVPTALDREQLIESNIQTIQHEESDAESVQYDSSEVLLNEIISRLNKAETRILRDIEDLVSGNTDMLDKPAVTMEYFPPSLRRRMMPDQLERLRNVEAMEREAMPQRFDVTVMMAGSSSPSSQSGIGDDVSGMLMLSCR